MLFSTGRVNGQNLVPNGDFEQGPTQSAEGWDYVMAGPDQWDTVIGSPDRIYFGDPLPSRDNDVAQSGMAYVEFFGEDTLSGLPAEIGKTILVSQLQNGQKYRLQYYLDVDDNFYNGSAGIAFRFNGGDSIASILQPNTGQWEYYDTTFTASGISTELEIIAFGGPSLVKIDNISLELDTVNGLPESMPYSVEIYPNPSSEYFIIKASSTINWFDSKTSLLLYDMDGELLNHNIEYLPNQEISIQHKLSKGDYILNIFTRDEIFIRRIIVN